MGVVLTSWEWVAGFYEGHLRVYASDEGPEPAWSTREDSRASLVAMMRSSTMLVVMTAKNKFQRPAFPVTNGDGHV